ncbi:MAG: ATP-binding protein [Verrucomicrobiota bacterium]
MVFKSIRWRLQAWYGLILLLVLAGFGVTAYQLQRGRQMGRIDDELLRRVSRVGAWLRPPPHGPGPGRPNFGPFRGPPPEAPGEPMRSGGPPRLEDRPGRMEGGPPPPASWFEESDPNGIYFLAWAPDGRLLASSTNAPAGLEMPAGPEIQDRPAPRQRGDFREVILRLPRGDTLLAGRSIAPELRDLRLVSLKLSAAGLVVLVIGLAGGGWLAARAIRPIDAIGATALRIAEGDLSQRIDLSETDTELGRLAAVLNSTFARLEAAFDQQRQFTSDAAHELRTPVSVMLTRTQSTLTRDRSAAEYREALESCQNAAQRMRRLIESLLELARLDAGQERLRSDPCDLARVAADVAEHLRPLAAERGVSLELNAGAAVCAGDSDRLMQVATNLVGNAIQFSREGGHVRISTRTEAPFVILEVADDGPGIAAEHLPHLFERFYRADASRSTGGGNAGLGLAIARAIVLAHRGEISAASEPGNGAIFTVRLPSQDISPSRSAR